uniref:Aspartyl/asparaginyl-tRNA synthetase n=1 Tax=Marseillevirus LCMAC201 TaxID=2506605 RepID=A0A481YWX8_9VIRU|nr:MAG: aspartyl/asparaginyl-tRNA synthetase [Marseillevirus LCMAC201]
MQPSNVDALEFNYVIRKLRDYCYQQGLIEAGVQHRRSILAACEDPETISEYNHGGQVWPLPQTGQMQLELEMLRRPKVPGFFTLTYSYRNEPNPIPNRHDFIFPMFEFELHGGLENLIQFEAGLLRYLGFNIPEELKVFDPSQSEEAANRGEWDDMATFLGVTGNDIGHSDETKIGQIFGPVFFLTNFPNKTSPFWNMRQDPDRPGHALKCDVIIHGMETFGSAERAIDRDQMLNKFKTISNGGYANLLYSKFTHDRVDKELNSYLEHSFFRRSGGGIGMTRLIRGMKLEGLLPILE